MNRNAAAEEFAKVLFRGGVEEGVKAFFDVMSEPMGHQRDKWERLRRWYESEDEEDRGILRVAIKDAMVLAVFGVAVHLDGASGGYIEVEEGIGELAVALNIYGSEKALDARTPKETIEICPTRRGEDVHDIF